MAGHSPIIYHVPIKDFHFKDSVLPHSHKDALGDDGQPADMGRLQVLNEQLLKATLEALPAWIDNNREKPLEDDDIIYATWAAQPRAFMGCIKWGEKQGIKTVEQALRPLTKDTAFEEAKSATVMMFHRSLGFVTVFFRGTSQDLVDKWEREVTDVAPDI